MLVIYILERLKFEMHKSSDDFIHAPGNPGL